MVSKVYCLGYYDDAKPFRVAPNPGIQGQHREARFAGTKLEHGREMNSIEGPNWLDRERPPDPSQHLSADIAADPVRCRVRDRLS